MPAKTERYRFMPWEIEDVDGIPRMLPGGYADVTRGGGMKFDQVVFVGPDGSGQMAKPVRRSASRRDMCGNWSK